jgi:hypothetical protein
MVDALIRPHLNPSLHLGAECFDNSGGIVPIGGLPGGKPMLWGPLPCRNTHTTPVHAIPVYTAKSHWRKRSASKEGFSALQNPVWGGMDVTAQSRERAHGINIRNMGHGQPQ